MNAIEPAFDGRAIPIAFAVDDNYAPLLAVAMRSAMDNADPRRNHDLLIMEDGLSPASREGLLSLARNNVSIRFVDMAAYLRGTGASTFFVSHHIGVATYYRFFLPDILARYDKALYLDSDLVVLGDVAELFDTDLGDNLLAAAPEPILMADVLTEIANNVAGGWRDYFEKTLRLREPWKYFQAGALVLNTAAMRRDGFTAACLECLERVRKPAMWDQDILNSVCRGRVKRLGLEWNHMCMAGGGADAAAGGGLPSGIREELNRAAAAPKIIHYTTGDKAWLHRESRYFEPFWRHAEKTAFHAELLTRLERREQELRAVRYGDSRRVAEAHRRVFSPHRDANRGRDLALVATGPSLVEYQPLPGVVHLGVNRAFMAERIRFDCLFVQSFFGRELLAGKIAEYGAGTTKKFQGVNAAEIGKEVDPGQGETYYYVEPGSGELIDPVADVERRPLANNGSVVFPALQFALFTRPRRLYLVGCDATGKGNLSAVAAGGDDALAAWRLFADFARSEYPEVEIVSVNPVRLAGMFADMHIDGKQRKEK